MELSNEHLFMVVYLCLFIGYIAGKSGSSTKVIDRPEPKTKPPTERP